MNTLPDNATEPMQKAMQRAVMLRKSMNEVWRAALSELPEPAADASAELERLRQALRDIAEPIAAWQRDLQPGYTLDGGMCVHMANDPETYKRMAREALRPNSSGTAPLLVLALNTAIDQVLSFQAQLLNVGDSVTLEAWRVTAYPT